MTKDDLVSKDTALKMAIDALELCDGNGLKDYDFCIAIHKCKTALNACKEALDTEQVREGVEPAQPVAWMVFDVYGNGEYVPNDNNKFFTKQTTATQKPIPLYTHPAQPLSDDAIAELWGEKWSGSTEMIKNFARAIEKAHGIGE